MQVWFIPIADERVSVHVKLWNPLRTRAIPGRFCGGDSLRIGAISSVCTFALYYIYYGYYTSLRWKLRTFVVGLDKRHVFGREMTIVFFS